MVAESMQQIVRVIKKTAACVILAAAVVFVSIPSNGDTSKQSNEKPDLNLYAQSAVLIDAESGRVLYEKNSDQPRPMASTTKIMTCILALEQGNLDDWVEITALAASQPKVHLGVQKGEKYRLRDLLYSLMLESHNDSAYAIAEHIGGSVEGFAVLMNQKARDIGCEDTWFITPNGLDAKQETADGTMREHSTTAKELAAIMRYCIEESSQKEAFLEITRTQNYSFSDQDNRRNHGCTNHNALLSMMEGALTGKTGFTGGAGYSYVGALERDERTFIIALLGCGWPPHKTYKWSDSRKLFDYGLNNYDYREVYREMDLQPIRVMDAAPAQEQEGEQDLWEPVMVSLISEAPSHTWKVLLRKDEQVTVDVNVPSQLKAPVFQGQVVGDVRYLLDGQVIRSFPVYAETGAARLDFLWCLNYVKQIAVLY